MVLLFYLFLVGRCLIYNTLCLAWIKLDAEILCTLNEYIQGFIVESNQCLNNPEIMTQFYRIEYAVLIARLSLDVYCCTKLY